MQEVIEILVTDIDPDPEQPRKNFDEAALLALGQNMKEIGQHVPILVFENKTPDLKSAGKRFLLADGERRYRAALACNIPTLKAIVAAARLTPVQLLKMQAGIDFHHLRLSWGERIDLAGRLQKTTGCTVNELASMLHISQSLASKLCTGRKAAPQVRQALDAGLIDLEKLIVISGSGDHVKQLEVLKGSEGLSRESLRQKVRSGGDPNGVKTSIARFPLPNGGVTVTVQGPKLNLADAIRAVTDVIKELKRGQAEHFDITAVARAMTNRCQTNS